MHFIVALILLAGFALVLGWGLLQVISDLSQMSFHAPPEIVPWPNGKIMRVERDTDVEPCSSTRTELHDA